ncbi:FG-GAP repeat domain-containing protein [Arthrobacter sp. NPDC057009]|uniref:FG-GAP repeat domain-containing protein n=1 Tax=Arthrobacter sp. NPDC057009 TaxID=3345996 RepID=UPI00364173EA
MKQLIRFGVVGGTSASLIWALAVGAVPAQAATCAPETPAPASSYPGTTVMANNFESGTLDGFSSTTGGTGTTEVSSDQFHSGTCSAHVHATADLGSVANLSTPLPAGTATAYADGWFNITQAGVVGNNVPYLRFFSGSVRVADIYRFNDNGQLWLRVTAPDGASVFTRLTTTSITLNAWHHVAMRTTANGAASTVEVWFDGAQVYSSNQVVSAATTLDRVQLGAEHNRQMGDTYVDDLVIKASPRAAATPSIRSAADVLAVGSDGTLWNYPATGQGSLGARQKIGAGWAGLAKGFITDWNSDGTHDVIAQWKDGRLSFYAGRPEGGFAAARAIGTGWGGYHITVGDWRTADQFPGILAYDASGTLWYYGNSAGASLSPRIKTGSGWGGLYLTMTDFDQDGAQDLLAKRSDGSLILYRSTGTGGFVSGARPTVGTGWNSISSITAVAGFTTGSSGLITQLSDGRLAHYPFSRGTWGARTIIGTGWSTFNVLR